ncbi:hypothetical protein Tco_0102270 [Tanacetum coccineum]
MIRLRAEVASTFHSLPLPSPLHLLSTDCREYRPEVTLPPRKRLGIALGPAYEVKESSSAAAARPVGGLRAYYGFVATMDREIRRDPERDVGYGITDSLDYPERLRGDRWMQVILPAERLCHCALPYCVHTADRRRQAMTSEMLKADHRRSAEMRELRTADRT